MPGLFCTVRQRAAISLTLAIAALSGQQPRTLAVTASTQTIECDILIVGGGLAGAAAAYEALLAGREVCLTEITDWVGGQISSQGTSALDERATQRSRLFFPRGYLDFRDRIEDEYGELNPGDCWVSASCFIPADAHAILLEQLRDAEDRGDGTLRWFPSTVAKEIDLVTNPDAPTAGGSLIASVTAIQHAPAPGTPPLNSEPLSQIIEDAYRYEDSDRLTKTVVQFIPPAGAAPRDWIVIEATETGELIGLADIPYRLGIDALSHLEPSSASTENDPYCTQGFTYTFAMEATEEPQIHDIPDFYTQYAPYFSYELERLANFDLVFTYRRIWSPEDGPEATFGGIGFSEPTPGDISMQNWTWGNDYRPGRAEDNLIYTREQLRADGQLAPGGWLGGLRTATLQRGEEHAFAYFYWLVAGTTDSQLGEGVKQLHPNYRFVAGFDAPMGTAHGLSKYPYIREGRRIIGRPAPAYPNGFTIWEVDLSRQGYDDEYYRQTLPPEMYRRLQTELSGRNLLAILSGEMAPEDAAKRTRSRIYADSVGIGHYAIDFHPCMTESPPEKPGNTEREGERQGAGQAYPFQIPLRATIPQEIDNLLVAGKSIATSHIAAAAYRVHSFEWSSGAAVGTTAAFALETGILPYEIMDSDGFGRDAPVQQLRYRLQSNGNPIAFPDTSIFNEDWDDWR
ncbi:FAD dependent oxidoreductase [Rubidibacter lacunae KORDI 51-2]|uniref:FAD dependent oxidoreductase n=1 Tax=Rubidibacter lacunae KORDI 51-2 TaxID=582515 RepID=U5DB33_9CHRO|nr:FAD-dependent oxidoreductase [Rubidibacter lacunae]ERN41753.1 FAD dependent oxidoreductase [Rubidibacter lacunae KORDI 51-2]